MDRDKKKKNNGMVSIGFIGHATIDKITEIKEQIENVEGFFPVYFTKSFGKLWIREGENDGSK